MSAPDLPRFQVSSDAYLVLDTWDVHRVVVDCNKTLRGQPRAVRMAHLEDRRVELEAWHEQAMSDG